jgi:hypothetical protein
MVRFLGLTIFLCSVMACAEVEHSAGMALDNANSVVRTSGDVMWGKTPAGTSAEQGKKETEEQKQLKQNHE